MATATYENWLNRKKGKQSGDYFKLDTKNKTPEQNIVEIIQGLYIKKVVQNEPSPTSKTGLGDFRPGLRNLQKNSSDTCRLSYLNALVTLLSKEDRTNLGFAVDELMTCIRISLVDESIVIRAAALRVLRYLIKTESDVATFNTLKLPYLVIRSMDLMVRNEEERAQALRVVRRVIGVVGAGQAKRHRAAYIDPGLLRCLTAVARAGSAGDGTGDRLARPAIATLAEICVLNPDLFITCGGVSAVTRQLAECATPRMAEALCGVLLHTLNSPTSRRTARVDLTGLSAPYCDFHVRPPGTDTTRDEREMRFTCSRLSLLCVLRSWPGLLHFCHPNSASGLRALVHALYLPRLEVRKAILDLLYELVGLPQPEWTDEISVALDAVDPSDFQDSWRLNEGFVAAEGAAILPHLSATGPDITEIHLALLLHCFLEAGLLDGLAEVIVTSDTFISVRATVLLGQLLHLIHLFLPPQICSITPALPSLMAQASEGKPQALAAVAALRKLHTMLEARPASNSLFLDHIIQYCSGAFREREEDMSKSKKEKENATMAKPKNMSKESSIEFLNESDNESEPKQRHSVGSRADVATRNVSALVKSKSVSSRTSAAVSKVTKTARFLFERDSDSLIRCTLVMQSKDGNTWNWEIIRTILKENESEPLLNLSESTHKAWVARVVNYLKPSANKYSHTDLSATCHGHSATRAGCQLIRHLLRHNDPDSQRLLEELFYDISRQVEAIETGRKAHECLFSPQHMCNTMCQMYFLFIGQLCHSYTGLRLFKQTRLYENLLELSTKTHHSCYVKLVISSLDYTLDSTLPTHGSPRDILAKTLTCNIQASRLYATQFLNVLLRASRKSRDLVRRKSKLKKNIVQEHLRSHKDDSESSGVDMDTWILQMLIGQVKDESKVVVKTALSILEEAFSVSTFVEKMLPMRDVLCRHCRLDKSVEPAALDLSAVGDRGYLLWLQLEVTAAARAGDAKALAFIKKHLDFWTKNYNYRYVRLVESGIHEALTLCEGSRPARARRAARPPPHLHAALAGLCSPHSRPSTPPRALLSQALPHHYKILQRKKCTTEQEIVDLKASLWAVGNTAVTAPGLQQLMQLSSGYLEDCVPVHVVRLAKYCPVYSVRATAFYALGLIGSTHDGANALQELGWLCVRHTRHEQFPMIPDEIYLSYDCSHPTVLSPDRRCHYDVDLSEHSDHTDQSVAESLQPPDGAVARPPLPLRRRPQRAFRPHRPERRGEPAGNTTIYLSYDCSHPTVLSPDRRCHYDVDLSEHSDHTDQSVAESLQPPDGAVARPPLPLRRRPQRAFRPHRPERRGEPAGNTTIYLSYDCSHPTVLSPDRRCHYDVDLSEHSDHTDQSVAESLQSDYTKKPDENQDVVDNAKIPDKRKSNTLPIQGCSSSQDRPTLSESRTVDILRDCAIYERPTHVRENRLLVNRQMSLEHHEGRVRNTSESSTSGVSSCDSFLGKYAIPDRVLTLSPIPSSSSLYGMKSSNSSQRARVSDLHRRTSTSSFTTADVASSPPTQMDMTGYATLKSLNKNRRPHLSESAATGSSEIDDISWLLSDSNRRSKPFSSLRDRAKTTRERMAKMSLLDYDWKPLSLGAGRQSPPPPLRAPRRPLPSPAPAHHPPAYIGICLPRDLMDLFPREEEGKEPEGEKEGLRRARVPSFLVDSSTASDNKSRATPDSQKLAAYRGGDVVRSAANFVANTMSGVAGPSSSRIQLFSNPRDIPLSLTEPTSGTFTATVNITKVDKPKVTDEKSEEKETDKSGGGDGTEKDGKTENKLDVITETANVSDAGAPSTSTSGVRSNVSTTASETGTVSSKTEGVVKPTVPVTSSAGASETGHASTVERWRHHAADCLACVPTRPPSSHQLREAFFAGE
ncbi:hypothetical protein O0L34_g16268 [Tuta absoluta]|nr:hypothetical protein O0L34_g16268 [Tuta absoluta]